MYARNEKVMTAAELTAMLRGAGLSCCDEPVAVSLALVYGNYILRWSDEVKDGEQIGGTVADTGGSNQPANDAGANANEQSSGEGSVECDNGEGA